MNGEEWRKRICMETDTGYSYSLAKRMEKYRTNPVLGYRTAGSRAEFETGGMLVREMESLGLSDVHKDRICVDSWEFEKAVMVFTDSRGREHRFQLGAYQTDFHTGGFREFSLVYLGKGTAADYGQVDVTGKLVLIDINQRDEGWINFPVYQAWLKGAAALIAVQEQGYGEINDEALNAQDIAGPDYAPAFSMSRADALVLKASMGEDKQVQVRLDASSTVLKDQETYNIIGSIPGTEEGMILLSAHYDSYFSGFQDDNAAVAMMLGIARAVLRSGYKPRKTLVFCAMAAEEWGVVNSKYDWSAGAYEQVFTARPDWAGKVIADLNFELPAHAHGRKDAVRCVYEYADFLEEFITGLPAGFFADQPYPEGVEVLSPIQTWSDDFSMAVGGIPSMVNDFTGGSFMETHYHSQFDNDDYYDEQVYRLHHELFLLLICELDQTAVVPLCFAPVMSRAGKFPGAEAAKGVLSKKLDVMKQYLKEAEKKAEQDYQKVQEQNRAYRRLLKEERFEEAEELFESLRPLEQKQLANFKKEQDTFVRIDWYGNVLYPHEILLKNIRLLEDAIEDLEKAEVSKALGRLYQVDNNAYAFMFDEDVYNHFTDYVFHQPRERLKWGYGRIMEHEKLYTLVRSLLEKEKTAGSDFESEIFRLKKVCEKQYTLLEKYTDKITEVLKETYLN